MLKIEVKFQWPSQSHIPEDLYDLFPEHQAYLKSPQFDRFYTKRYGALGNKKNYIVGILKNVPTLHIVDHGWDCYRGRVGQIAHMTLACNYPQELKSTLEDIMEELGAIGSVVIKWKDQQWECHTFKSVNGFKKIAK